MPMHSVKSFVQKRQAQDKTASAQLNPVNLPVFIARNFIQSLQLGIFY